MKFLIAALILTLTVNSQGADQREVKLTINARVMHHLHDSLATTYSRSKMREMLDRLETYRPMIEAKLTEAHLPREILALPAVESMYRANARSTASAGLWQLLPETARKFGLRVDNTKDERLDAEKETTAAIAYLRYIHAQTGDWPTTILSYNAGESRVRQMLRQANTKDVSKLKLSSEEHRNYVSKIMAAMILIEHPQLVSN